MMCASAHKTEWVAVNGVEGKQTEADHVQFQNPLGLVSHTGSDQELLQLLL